MASKKLKKAFVAKPVLPVFDRTYSFQYALKQKHELVPLNQAVGRMCADNAGIVPPCTPVIIIGEIITEAAVKVLQSAKNTYGITGGKVLVVKK